MKKIMTKSIAVGMIAAVAGTVSAAEDIVVVEESTASSVSVTMDFVSSYVFRGVTLSDEAGFQPGIEVSGLGLPAEYGSITVGVWGAGDFDGDDSSTFIETDYYASYSLPIDFMDVSIGYTEYTYSAGEADKEMSIGLGYEVVGIGLAATFYQGVGGLIGSTRYFELGAGYDLPLSDEFVVSFGARVGYADQADNGVMDGESGFSDYDIGLAASYALSERWSAGASIAYIGQIDDDVLTDDNYDKESVGMFSLAYEM